LTAFTRFVSTIAAHEDANVHLIGTLFHPLKKSIDTIPELISPKFFARKIGSLFPLKDKFLVSFWKLVKGKMDIHIAESAGSEKIVLAFTGLTALEWFDNTRGDAQRAIRHDPVVIESNDTAKSATDGTCSQRVIKAKETWGRRSNIGIAVSTMPARGVGETLASFWINEGEAFFA
jgi:hypothetical protein